MGIKSSVILVLTLLIASPAAALPLVDDGKSEYVIVVGANAIAAEQFAAQELASHVEQMSGVKLPVRTDAGGAMFDRECLMEVALTFSAVVVLACIHLFAGRARFLDTEPHSPWLSAAAGFSLAYVMLHILPKLAEKQPGGFSAPVKTFLNGTMPELVNIRVGSWRGTSGLEGSTV